MTASAHGQTHNGATGRVRQPCKPQDTSVAFLLGLAECARAARGAAFLEPQACAQAAEAAEVPKWKGVPKACGR